MEYYIISQVTVKYGWILHELADVFLQSERQVKMPTSAIFSHFHFSSAINTYFHHITTAQHFM